MARRPRRSSPPSTTSKTIRRRRPRRRKGTSAKKPVSYNHRTHPAKARKTAPGHCRWCGCAILKVDGTINRRRSWCSQTCVGQYLLRADPKVMRQHVFFRDDGVCGMCNRQHKFINTDWQADHIEPLFLAYGDPSFWEPENVQVLCTDPCHKIKSKSDMERYGFVLKMTRSRNR